MENKNEPNPVTPPMPAAAPASNPTSPAVTEAQVWAALRECYDPEIPVNVVDLGLIYDVAIQGSQVNVKMTLTTPGCMMAGQIANHLQTHLLALAGVEEANVELVWDPPWHQSMISPEGRKILGIE